MQDTSKLVQNIRLASFPLGLGLISVLVGGTLNRVMIVELNMPAVLVGLFFALPLLISPLRVWLGYQSDAHPIWGMRREPLIVIGSLVSSLGIIGVTVVILTESDLTVTWVGIVVAAFLAYGVGKNLSSNTFEALLADKFKGDQRPRAVTFYKVAMFVGIMIGAVLLGRLLDPFSIQRLLLVVVAAASLSFTLALVGVFRQEPRLANTAAESERVRRIPFWETFKDLVWADPQIRRFFIFVMLTVIGTLAQDVLLEPYAALVLKMSVGETTSLTAIWGAGTLLAMTAAGMRLIKRFGYEQVVRIGLVLGVTIFIGLVFSGMFELRSVFLGLVFLLGISTGLSASGMLAAVIDFTTPERAGLLMGVWGVAHNVGQALGGLLSGGVVDVVRLLNGDALTAYGTVFVLEALLLLAALGLLSRIKITQARVIAESRCQEI